MVSLEFLVTSLVVVLIPGTGVIYTVSTGLVQGRKASVFAALGCTAGIVPHLIATVLGLAAVMHTSAVAFQALKCAGVAYLFYLAYAAWRDNSAFVVDRNSSARTAFGLVAKAFLLNILNPKLTIFFLAFLPQFVPSDATAPLLQLVLLSAIFMAMTFVVFVVWLSRACLSQARHPLAAAASLAPSRFRRDLCRAWGESRAGGEMTPSKAFRAAQCDLAMGRPVPRLCQLFAW